MKIPYQKIMFIISVILAGAAVTGCSAPFSGEKDMIADTADSGVISDRAKDISDYSGDDADNSDTDHSDKENDDAKTLPDTKEPEKDYNTEGMDVITEDLVFTENDTDRLSFYSLEELPDDFTLEDALYSEMLVLSGMDMISGEDVWEVFLDTAEEGKEAQVMIAHHYEIGDPEHYSAELYEQMKDDYPKLYVFLLEYDGEAYTLSHYEEDKLYSYNYPYLIERIGLMNNAAMATHGFYLVRDKEVTFHALWWSMFSSSLVDRVDYQTVFTESVDKAVYLSCQPGTYAAKDQSAQVTIEENCRFFFIRGAASYSPAGRYFIEEDKLILRAAEEEQYIFHIEGKGILTFESGKYAEYIVPIGTKFIHE